MARETSFPEFEERFPLGEMSAVCVEKISLKGINVESCMTGLIFSAWSRHTKTKPASPSPMYAK